MGSVTPGNRTVEQVLHVTPGSLALQLRCSMLAIREAEPCQLKLFGMLVVDEIRSVKSTLERWTS